MIATYGAVYRYLAWVFVHLLNHILRGAVPWEGSCVRIAFDEGGSGYLCGVIAGGIVALSLGGQVWWREYSLPY